MKFVRRACDAEVLASAAPKSQRRVLRASPYSVWLFTAKDIAAIVGRLPNMTHAAPLGELAAAWEVSLQQDPVEMSRFQRAFSVLLRRGALAQPPILYPGPGYARHACYTEEGLEPLFAALEFASSRSAFSVEVFWSDAGGLRSCFDLRDERQAKREWGSRFRPCSDDRVRAESAANHQAFCPSALPVRISRSV